MKEQTCCFTGHRQIPLAQRARIAAALEARVRELIAQGFCYFGAGGALGFDTMAAETVLRLREEYPAIRLILVLPCADQSARWAQEDVLLYEEIKQKADKCVCLAPHYYNGCMQARNRRLVDESAACICYMTDEKSGTGYTVRYAQKSGLAVYNVAK